MISQFTINLNNHNRELFPVGFLTYYNLQITDVPISDKRITIKEVSL